MWRNVLDFACAASLAHDMPDDILADTVTPYFSRPTNCPEHSTARNARRGCPKIHCVLDPFRHWHGSNMTAFTDQIDYCPMLLARLDVLDRKTRKLAASQPTANQDREHGFVPSRPYVSAGYASQDRRALFE